MDHLLQLYIKSCGDLLRAAEELLHLYGDQIRAFNEGSHAVLVSFIESLQGAQKIRRAGKLDLGDMYDIFDSMANIERCLDKVLAVISTLRLQKYDPDLNTLTASVRDKIQEYKIQRAAEDPKILALVPDQSVDESCSFVLSRKANKLSIHLISRCFSHASPPQQRKLMAFVEAQKNKLLGGESRIKSAAELPPATQSFICRYSLFGVTPSYDAYALFKYLGARYDEAMDFASNLRRLDNSVVIINSASQSPVEYTLAPLIDEKFITENKLIVSPTAGVNTTFIKKMQTVRLLPAVEGVSAGPPTVFAKGEHLPWYVLETLDGATHRVLGKYTAEGVSIVHEYSEIVGLFEGVPARAHQYNAIQTAGIMKYYQPDLRIIRDAFSRRPTLKFNTDLAKANSVESLVAWYEETYNTVFVPSLWAKKGAGASETRSKYIPEISGPTKTITSAEKRIAIFTRRLVRFTGEFTRDHQACAIIMKVVTAMYDSGPNTDEDIVTRLVQYDIIVTTFHQEFDRLWDSSLPALNAQLHGALADASANDHELTAPQTHRLAMMVVLDTLRPCWTAAVDHLDRSKQWTEYGNSIKLFTIHA
jgi:hypothetical protein